MVARGDLGVELPLAQVPLQQKAIIRKANAAGKPVITATQMLESMISHPRPTRAEASDVANAILDGTDAVMLSGETAVGAYPVEAVRMMEQIARAVEEAVPMRASWRENSKTALTITDAIGTATCEIAEQLGARLILTATTSGSTARMISRHRPHTPIFAVTTSAETQRRLALVWGVECVVVRPLDGMEGMVAQSLAAAQEHGVVQEGDVVVVTAGVPVGIPGRTNMIQVHIIGENH
jgi:pyruvate kinase